MHQLVHAQTAAAEPICWQLINDLNCCLPDKSVPCIVAWDLAGMYGWADLSADSLRMQGVIVWDKYLSLLLATCH
jgi:hypothetical protein